MAGSSASKTSGLRRSERLATTLSADQSVPQQQPDIATMTRGGMSEGTEKSRQDRMALLSRVNQMRQQSEEQQQVQPTNLFTSTSSIQIPTPHLNPTSMIESHGENLPISTTSVRTPEPWDSWPDLPTQLHKRYKQLRQQPWKVMCEMEEEYEVETWIWCKKKQGDKYKTISANGMESYRTEKELRRDFEKCLRYGKQVCDYRMICFPDEIIPSIISYFENASELRWQRQWSALYSPWSTNLWYDMKCSDCNQKRMLSLKHWMIVHEHIPVDKRHCALLGVPCHRPSTRNMGIKMGRSEKHVERTTSTQPTRTTSSKIKRVTTFSGG